MKANASIHADHNQPGLFSRVARDVSSAMDWLTGPAMSEQERQDRVVAQVQNLKCDASAMQLQ